MLALAISYWNLKNEQILKEFEKWIEYVWRDSDQIKNDDSDHNITATAATQSIGDGINTKMQMISSGTFNDVAYLLTGRYYQYTQYPKYRNHKFLRDIEPVIIIIKHLVSNNFVFKLSQRDNDTLPKVYLSQFYEILASIVDVNRFQYLTFHAEQYGGRITVRTTPKKFATVVSNIDLLYNIVTFDHGDCKHDDKNSNQEFENDSKVNMSESSLSSLDKSSIKHYQCLVIKLIKLMHQLMMKSISYHNVSNEESYRYYEKLMCQYDRTQFQDTVENTRLEWKDISYQDIHFSCVYDDDEKTNDLRKVIQKLDDIVTHCLT